VDYEQKRHGPFQQNQGRFATQMTLGPWPTLQNTRASLPAILKVSCKCPLNQFLKIWAAFCSWTQMKFWLDLHMSDGPGVAEDAIGFFPIL